MIRDFIFCEMENNNDLLVFDDSKQLYRIVLSKNEPPLPLAE